MMATVQTAERTSLGLLPRALNEWLHRETLVELVQEVVKNADWTQPGYEARMGRMKTARSEILLLILTYCYAIGIYRSQEIEESIYREKAGRELFASLPVDAAVFCRFRRYNRDLIHDCLVNVLRRVFQMRWNGSKVRGNGHCLSRTSTNESGDVSAFYQELSGEAARRIDQAVELDALDRDGQ